MSSVSSFSGKPAKPEMVEPSDYFYHSTESKNFVPSDVQRVIDDAIGQEERCTADMEAKLQASWRDVENWQSLNRKRVELLVNTDLALEPVEKVVFWSDDLLCGHLKLNSFLDEQLVASMDGKGGGGTSSSAYSSTAPSVRDGSTSAKSGGRRHSRVAFKPKHQQHHQNPNAPTVSSRDSSSAADSSEADGSQSVKARKPLTAEQLDDKGSSAAPLRRVFGPLLQKRASLPRELNLLFLSIDKLQKNEFLEMEKVLAESSLSVAMHTPFVRIQKFIQKHLTVESAGAEAEKVFTERSNPVIAKLKDEYDRLGRLWSDDDAESATKVDACTTMWQTLNHELIQRRALNQQILEAEVFCAEYEQKVRTELPQLLQNCVDETNSEFKLIEEDAQEAFAVANELYQRAGHISAESVRVYEADRTKLTQGIKAAEYKCEHSQSQQDKMIRRIREAVKELRVEQGRHGVFMKDLLYNKLRLKQLDVSYQQFRAALAKRQEMMVEAHTACLTLNDLLASASATKEKLLTECKFHVSRLQTEEQFRCCRFTDRAVQNAQQWSRVTNDITALFEARRDHVHLKSAESWQLNYLLGRERERTMENIAAIRVEYKKIETVWAALSSEIGRLELPTQMLEALEKEEKCQATRRVLMDLDEDIAVAKSSLIVQEALLSESTKPCSSASSAARLAAIYSNAKRDIALFPNKLPHLKAALQHPGTPKPPPRRNKSAS